VRRGSLVGGAGRSGFLVLNLRSPVKPTSAVLCAPSP